MTDNDARSETPDSDTPDELNLQLDQLQRDTRRLRKTMYAAVAVAFASVLVALAVIFVPAVHDIVSGFGFSNVKETKITKENEGDLIASLKDSKALTVEEVGLLQAYVIRHGFKQALSGEDVALPVGQTVGGIIEEQRLWLANEEIRAEEEKRLKEEARAEDARRQQERDATLAAVQAEREKNQEELRGALSVTLYDKGFKKIDYSEAITFKFAYENHTDKDIRGFKGNIVFVDLFGDKIMTMAFKEDEVVRARSKRQQTSLYLDYNQFIDRHQTLATTPIESLRARWEPTQILFADGTSLAVSD